MKSSKTSTVNEKLSIITSEMKNKLFNKKSNSERWNEDKTEPAMTEITPTMMNSGNFMKQPDSLHLAFRPILILAQCFAVLPVNGVNSPNPSDLKFTWRSFKILYFAVSLTASLFATVCNTIRIFSGEFHSVKMTTLVFSSTSCLCSLLFLKLAKGWPNFVTSWDKVESQLATRHRALPKVNLARRFKLITGAIMTFASIEHALSLISGYFNARECAIFRSERDIIAVYFKIHFPEIFHKTSYTLWKGIVFQLCNVLSTFTWNFMDLFVILMSTALTYHFCLLNERLNSIKDKVMPDWWWAEARADFNRLASLTRQADSYISSIILLSFGNNLYFICIQLMNSFDRMPNLIRKIYFSFSFGLLIARAAAVSLSAASVHDEAGLPAPVLYSVQAPSYTTEVQRFLTQVTTDYIGLTGMKFFSITRSLVLTVAGTIVTYELVLIQFNAVQQVNPSNMTSACEVDA